MASSAYSGGTVSVQGMEELSRKLQRLPPKMADAILVKGLRRAAFYVRNEARNNVRGSKTGRLRKSIGLSKVRASRTLNHAEYHVGWRRGKGVAWYGFIHEFGSSAHTIKIVNKKVLYSKVKDRFFGTQVTVRGKAPRPHMVPALENNNRTVMMILRKEGRKGLSRLNSL